MRTQTIPRAMHKRYLALAGGVGLAMAASYVSPANAATGLLISDVSQGAEGTYVGFTTNPPGCTASYRGYHALVRNTNPALSSIFATLIQRRATKSPVEVIYDTAGICDRPSTLLVVREVK